MKGQLTFAGTVRPGDQVRSDGRYVTVEKVRRAQGRKPSSGENLHLVTTKGAIVKINSTNPVWVIRSS